MTMREEDRDLIEVVIACTNGQIGRAAAIEIIADLDAAGFEIVRKCGDGEERRPLAEAAADTANGEQPLSKKAPDPSEPEAS